ncbi:MAG TPA: aldehyde dehydrogenase family protein [Solirubrobacter sp.]|jgi:acyl-CoA reductase-like NAD-dependent aldehyde dehydrogenase|nr:aldehyde dehydrogenase family protein [Solirubrobacter sp.]
MTRQPVVKTYKLYVGGSFVRSESGRTDPVAGANVPRSSRKDVRDAVKAARAAQSGWAKKTAYNRGQVLYRFAEALESRSDEFARAADAPLAEARAEVGAAVDLLVHYAGWTDKFSAVMGGINPVAAPYLSFSVPEPTGVVAVLAPDKPDLLGLIREIAPALAAGNTVVAIVSRSKPLRSLDLGEVAGVSDIPGGVLNLLSGRMDELLTPLCGHRDVNAIVDATGEPERAATIDELAAETVKRVSRPANEDTVARIEALTELKTAWHPIGA